MSVRRSLAWSYGGQAFVFAQTFVVSVIVARILGPYEMGIFAIGAATAGAMSIISSFSVGAYLIRHVAPDAALKATAFTVNAALNLLVSGVLFCVVLVGPRFGLIEPVRQVLALLAITPLIGAFEFLPSTFIQREMKFKQLSLVSMCRALVSSAILLSMASSGFGYLSPAVAAVGSSLFTAVAFNALARSHSSLRLGLDGWRDLTKFGMQMMSIGGLASLIQRLSELILGHFLGLAALGIYTRASSLNAQIWDNLYGLSTRVIFAQMSREWRESGTVRRTFLQGMTLITAVFGPVFIGLAVLSLPLIQTLYGDKWIAAAVPLSLLMLGSTTALGFSMNWELCVVRHRTGWQARNEGIRAVVGLFAFTIGAAINVVAAAAGRVFEVICGLLLFGPAMREMAGAAPGEITRVYRQSSALTLAAVGPSFAVMLMTDWSPHTPWRLILPAIATGVALWFITLLHLNHPLLAEIKRAGRFAVGRFQPSSR